MRYLRRAVLGSGNAHHSWTTDRQAGLGERCSMQESRFAAAAYLEVAVEAWSRWVQAPLLERDFAQTL